MSCCKNDNSTFAVQESWVNPDMLSVVGHCPSCGAPIYGEPHIAKDAMPQARYSCHCWRKVNPDHANPVPMRTT